MTIKAAAVKFAAGSDDTIIEGWGAPFGGPYKGGRDLDGEFFTKNTDFALDWFSERPLIFEHGIDGEVALAPIGRVKSWDVKDRGLWVQAQLDTSSKYWEAIKELVDAGKLFFSSGSITHLIQRKKSGEITRWPWVELTTTTHPAHPGASLDFAEAEKHYKAAGLEWKALPDAGTPVDGDSGDPPEGSYEDLIADLNRAIRASFTEDDDFDCYCFVVATFPAYCVACVVDGADQQYYEIAYELDADGEPVLGDRRAVDRQYVPVEMPPSDEAPMAMQATRLADFAGAVGQRAKALADRRAREHRTLSAKATTDLLASADAAEQATAALRALLADTPRTDPQAKAVVDVRRRVRDAAVLQLFADSLDLAAV